MKKIFVVLFCMFFAISMVSAQDAKAKDKKVTKKFYVENMDCENCVKKIEKNIAFEKGVTDMKCDLKTKVVELTYRTDKTTDEKLLAAFEKIDKKAVILKEK
jgi:Copper chaperone